MQACNLNKHNLWFYQVGLTTPLCSFILNGKAPLTSVFGAFSFLCGRGHSDSTWESKAHTVGTLKGATWARSRAWERWQAGQNDSLSTIVSVLTIA